MNSKYDLHSCLPIYLQTILNQIQIHYNTVLLWRLSDKSILYLYVCSQLKPEQKRYQLHVLYFVTCVIVTNIWCWSTLLSHWINEESFNMPVSYKLSPVVHVTIISNSLILKFQFNIYAIIQILLTFFYLFHRFVFICWQRFTSFWYIFKEI